MFTYLICCTANGSAIFSIIVKVNKEIRTIQDFYDAVPSIQKEAEAITNKKFTDFGVLSFTKLEDN